MDQKKVKHPAVIFDFDGTMCRLFENFNMKKLLDQLHEEMRSLNIDFSHECDSFEVFSAIASQTDENSEIRNNALQLADKIIRAAECEAVETGIDVTGIKEFILYLQNNNIPVGIATNNSEECIHKFFRLRDINDENIHISGRNGLHPERLKPDPWTLSSVIGKMKTDSENAVFIGDGLNDYASAKELSLRFIGMASTPKKMKRLLAIPDKIVIIEDYRNICKIFSDML